MRFRLAYALIATAFSGPQIAAAPLPDFEDHLAVLDWIYLETDSRIQHQLALSFIKQVPPKNISDCCQKLWQIDGSQTDNLSAFLFWAAKDPESAWPVAEQFLDICSSHHFSDQWSETKTGPDPAATGQLSQSPIWPGVSLLESFLPVVERNGAYNTPEGRKRAQAFRVKFKERTGRDLKTEEPPAVSYEDFSPYFSDVRLILTCPLNEVYPMLQVKALSNNYPAMVFGWERLAKSDPVAALQKQGADGPTILKTWAKHSPQLLWEESMKFSDTDLKDEAFGFLLAFAPQTLREKVITEIAKTKFDEDDPRWYSLLSPMMREFPAEAVDLIRSTNFGATTIHPSLVDEIILDAFYDTAPNSRGRIKRILKSHDPILSDENAYILIEEWGDSDVGEAARYCVSWHLQNQGERRSRLLKARENWKFREKEDLINIWTGKENPWDATMDDRTFGVLRKWALCQPMEMLEWIGTLEDPEIKAALLWLHGNAAGGFPTGKAPNSIQ